MLSQTQIRDFLKSKGIIIPEKIIVHRVLNLLKNEYYHIVVIQDSEMKNYGLYIINSNKDMQIEQSATLSQIPAYQKPSGLMKLEKDFDTEAIMVWQPCRLSYSPFYPFWKIKEGEKTLFFDAGNKVYNADEITNTMHG